MLNVIRKPIATKPCFATLTFLYLSAVFFFARLFCSSPFTLLGEVGDLINVLEPMRRNNSRRDISCFASHETTKLRAQVRECDSDAVSLGDR